MGELVFRKGQYGKEVTRGTAVVATKVWPGIVTVPSDRKFVFPELTTGRRARAQAGVVNQVAVDGMALKMDQGVFQVLPMLLSMAVKGGVTASEVTSGQADYAWDFTPSLTAANAQNAYTVEFGDDTQAYEVEYVMANSLKFGASLGENAGVSVEATCFGKQISPVTYTASLAPLAYEYMVANMTKIYIDPAWASLGSTEVTGLLQEWSWELLTGLHPKFHAAGVKTMTSHGEGFFDVMATLTLEGGTAADGLWDAFRLGTPKAVRIEVIGNQIGTGTTHKLTLDTYGMFEEIVPLGGERAGNNLHTAVFHAIDDNTGATPHMFACKVTTDQNAV